jgi:nanoRNase/pAp phosphatase (c-di-AMP/oligoRNAs hydrolase)
MEAFRLAKNILERSQTIAIAPGEDFKGDAFAASLVLFSILKKLGKNTTFLAKEVPARLRSLQKEMVLLPRQETIFTIDIRGKQLSQLRYEKIEDKLAIYLTLEKGSIKESDIFLAPAPGFSFPNEMSQLLPDLVVSCGISHAELLKKTLSFESIPSVSSARVLNIDNDIENTGFGSLNLIDHLSPSISEIVGYFILTEYGELVDKYIATILLAGLLLGSQNFRHHNTGPKTFELAAVLLEKGADHQLVVKHLYKTKSAAQLRLLGRALEKLEAKRDINITLTSLTQTDFDSTGTSSKDLAFVFEELKTHFWKTDSLVLLWESHGSGPLVKGIFSSKDQKLMKRLLQNFEGLSRGETALFLVREPLLEKAKEKVLTIWSR